MHPVFLTIAPNLGMPMLPKTYFRTRRDTIFAAGAAPDPVPLQAHTILHLHYKPKVSWSNSNIVQHAFVVSGGHGGNQWGPRCFHCAGQACFQEQTKFGQQDVHTTSISLSCRAPSKAASAVLSPLRELVRTPLQSQPKFVHIAHRVHLSAGNHKCAHHNTEHG
jgi:hypothetical protein